MKPTDPTSNASGKKVFDVMRPGKAPAPATSKPIIVSDTPPVKDSQFSSLTHKKIDLAPIGGVPELNGIAAQFDPQAGKPPDNTPSDISPEAIAQGEAPPEPAPDQAAQDSPAPEPFDSFDKAQDKSAQGKDEDEPFDDAQDEEADIGKAALDAAMVQDVSQEEEAAAFEPQQMIISKAHPKQHSKTLEVVIILLVVVLLVVIVDLLLDTGLIKLGAIPHTNFL